MQNFDIFTTLAVSNAIFLLLGMILFLFWSRDRVTAGWLAWWGGAFVILAFANTLVMSEMFITKFWADFSGTSLGIIGVGTMWQAARRFENRDLILWPVAFAATTWVALFQVPEFNSNVFAIHVGASSTLTIFSGLATYEIWRGRGEQLPSRNLVMAVLAILTTTFCMRVLLVGVAPFPVGRMPVTQLSVAMFNGGTLIIGVLLAVLLISMRLERQELNQRDLAQTDPLTGFRNRRALDAHFGHKGIKQGTAVVVFDLDKFKGVNDKFGHGVGDELLVLFTKICRENIRQVDFSARLGGEEFAIILSGISCEDALLIAERIRTQFAVSYIDTPLGRVKCTVSAGVDYVTQGQSVVLSTVLSKADEALYRAKRSGRNRVCFAKTLAAA